MTESAKTDVIASLISIAYYWVGEQNRQAAESILGLLKQVQLEEKMKKKVDDLDADIHTFFHLPSKETLVQHVKIPSNKSTEEEKLLWVAGVCLMNLFQSGNFELAYTMLMDMSINWEELYKSVLNTIKMNNKNSALKNELANWLMTHFFMAYDLLGTDEIKMMGFIVKKDETADSD